MNVVMIYYHRERRSNDDDQWRTGKGRTTSKRRNNKLHMWLYGRGWFNDTVRSLSLLATWSLQFD